MRNQITITESCSAGEDTCNLDYDLLPLAVKQAVDKALLDPENMVAVDIYKQGLQSIPDVDFDACVIQRNEVVRNMGAVIIYHEND